MVSFFHDTSWCFSPFPQNKHTQFRHIIWYWCSGRPQLLKKNTCMVLTSFRIFSVSIGFLAQLLHHCFYYRNHESCCGSVADPHGQECGSSHEAEHHPWKKEVNSFKQTRIWLIVLFVSKRKKILGKQFCKIAVDHSFEKELVMFNKYGYTFKVTLIIGNKEK